MHRRGDLGQAEVYFRSAIDVARQQQAKSWELRAATSYAALLMENRGQRKDALAVLQPVYDWFTEGRCTKDHIEASALLADLQ